MKRAYHTPYGRFTNVLAAAQFILENRFEQAFNTSYPADIYPRRERIDWSGTPEVHGSPTPAKLICNVIMQLSAKKVPGWFEVVVH